LLWIFNRFNVYVFISDLARVAHATLELPTKKKSNISYLSSRRKKTFSAGNRIYYRRLGGVVSQQDATRKEQGYHEYSLFQE
jgi:hypothetical protein